MTKKRRTENLSIRFIDRNADEWAFVVGDCFRTQLDIRLDERIDAEANKGKEARLGRKLEASEKIKRRVWTQGVPPAYSFGRAQIFHERSESAEGIKRTIVVELARPDPGALIEREVSSEDGQESTVVAEDTSEEASEGFVDFYILTYQNGVLATGSDSSIRMRSSLSQSRFVELLQTGN